MNRLDKIVEIYRSLDSVNHVDGTREGFFVVTNSNMRSFLLQVEDDSSFSAGVGLTLLSERSDVNVGANVRVRLFDPNDVPIYKNLTSLLSNRSRLLGGVETFYLIDEDLYSNDANSIDLRNKLNKLHDILVQLIDASAFYNESSGKLFFSDSSGFVAVPMHVTDREVYAIELSSASDFIAFFSDELHRRHRLDALTKTVLANIRNCMENDRLSVILNKLNDIFSDAKHQHAIFLSAFSYEKVRDEVEAVKVEYTAKIHKVLSDIQGQLLGIPAATFIVATQMKVSKTIDMAFFANSAILVGAFIFVIFLYVLIENQKHTLEVIRTEVCRQENQFKSVISIVANSFSNTFATLNSRIKHQCFVLRMIKTILISGLILSCISYYFLNSYAIKVLMQSAITYIVDFVSFIIL